MGVANDPKVIRLENSVPVLTTDELARPMLVIAGIFDLTSGEYLRLYLLQLMKTVLSSKPWSFCDDPSIPVEFITSMKRLVRAMYILHQEKNSPGPVAAPDGSPDLSMEEKEYLVYLYPVLDNHKGRIRRLSKAEVDDPYLALEKFFKWKGPEVWLNELDMLCYYSLKPVSMAGKVDDTFIINFEYLEKLLEVAWIFNDQKNQYESSIESCFINSKLQKDLCNLLSTQAPATLRHSLHQMFITYLNNYPGEFPENHHDILRTYVELMEFFVSAEKEAG